MLIGLAGVAGAGAASATAACPNEGFRVGPSALLPGCQAYEMVSPVDKNGASVRMNIEARVSPSGDAASFVSSGAFAGAPSNVTLGLYVSDRGTANWSTRSGGAPQLNPGFLIVKAGLSSPDLTKALQYSKAALAPGAIEGGSNVYLWDKATGERTLVAAEDGDELFQSLTGVTLLGYVDGTPDWSHFFFSARGQVLPEAAPGVENLYEYAEGELRLVNWLPDETVAPDGGEADANKFPYANLMSSDGSRIFFTSGPFGDQALYLREDGETTTAISASQKTGEEGTIAEGGFQGASDDGSVVYFTSNANLTDGSDTSSSTTIYRYEVDSGELTDITSVPDNSKGAQVRRVLALSEDGSQVYFAARSALTEDSTEAGLSGSNLYRWHDGQIDFVVQLPTGQGESQGPTQRLASPSGDQFAFASVSPLSGEDVPSPACTSGRCRDVYSYEAATGALTCVTCTGAPAAGHSNLGGQEFHEEGFGNEFARALLENGSVFADTPNRLVTRDLNGVVDAYAWREGQSTLLSTGMATTEANFANATPDGSTVLIRTPEQLVPQDSDQGNDVYAVRANGGLAGQFPPGEPAPCEGEACRGQLPPAQPIPLVSTGGERRDGDLPAKCLALSRRAKAAERRAGKLERRARKAGRSGNRKAARKLRRKARKQEKKANRLSAKARNCGGQG